ncbi:MAG: hypothetical protein M3N41_13760 [Acidobacteriota bacterium]|nr:hypothetical protein [Acidobacteriota bacterium]
MRIQKLLLGIVLAASLVFCGLVAVASLGALLHQADTVVVARVENASAATGLLSVDLVVQRTLKGSANVGSSMSATLSSPNVVTPGDHVGLRMNGAVVASQLAGTTGVWFLQPSGSGWLVLSLVIGDMSTEDLYIPVPPGKLPAAYAYDSSTDLKTKLLMEIGAAAEDSTTVAAISRIEAQRMLVDLGPDLRPFFNQLASSPRAASRAIGWAGQIRLDTPSALSLVASSPLGTFPREAESELANAVCEYRSTDASGISALATLVGSRYSERMRVCAAYALRDLHMPQTVSVLEKLLEDKSVEVRYDAVIGIAQFAMNLPIARLGGNLTDVATYKAPPSVTDEMRHHYPAQGVFAVNEQEYISFWKNWLAAHPR